jgi:protein TonB
LGGNGSEGRATLYEFLETIRDFLDRGGQVIVVIAWVIFVMWALIIERMLYLNTVHAHQVHAACRYLSKRPDKGSWSFEAIRVGTISQLGQRLQNGIPVIKTLAAVCPLLGLLGTVTGMIVIFDVMASMGTSSPRGVAGGIAQATMTTMAGMVGALSGIFPAVLLSRHTSERIDSLHHDHALLYVGPTSRLPSLDWFSRVPIALVTALFITLLLLYGMQRLIETGKQALTDPVSVYMPDFVRVQREESVEQKQLKPDKVPPPAAQPESTVVPQPADMEAGGMRVSLNTNVDARVDVSIAGAGGYEAQDGDYLPLVKVQPIYPRRAESRGISGWVLVEFTVTVTGAVRNVVVIESTDSVFERAAVQAALRFKYRPRVVDGVAVEVTGVQHYIRFEIEE